DPSSRNEVIVAVMATCIALYFSHRLRQARFRPEIIPTPPRSLQSLNTPFLDTCDKFAFAGAFMPVDDHNSTWGGVVRALPWGLGVDRPGFTRAATSWRPTDSSRLSASTSYGALPSPRQTMM